MTRISQKIQHSLLRRRRTRKQINGTPARPRLSVFISHSHVTAQLIDDSTHRTLAYASTVGVKQATGTLTDKAIWVGAEISKKAKAAQVRQVVFDRGSRLYHGRIKALANAAREGGLEF